MNSALFTYRRRVVDPETNEESFNDNFINPLNVISFYWSGKTTDDGKASKVLNVFLANNFSLAFGESVGKRFVEHMEDFLRFMMAVGMSRTTQNNSTQSHSRTARRPIDADIVEEVSTAPDAQWQ